MSSLAATGVESQPALHRLLERPRFEVIPVKGIEEKVAALPAGSVVTVTASAAHGITRTVQVSERLSGLGYKVVPHLAARMIGDRRDLERIVDRYAAAGIDEAFAIGGDASPPAGRYAAAADLLDELAALDHPFVRIGIAGYPEGHPLIDDRRLLEALRRKQPHAAHIVTQLCFDADALARWIGAVRAAGIGLPVVVGLPGAVERRKLAEISLRTGVGASLRYLRRHGREMFALARSRRYDPTPLARSVAAHLDDPGLGIAGAHLFTFNQIEETRDWVRRAATASAAA